MGNCATSSSSARPSLTARSFQTPARQGHAEKVLKEFLGREPMRIEGAEELARRLARLTHLIRDGIVAAFQTGNASELLTGWRSVFAQTLLPELAEAGREAEFADMFAQTLAYGLFSARALSGLSARFTLAEAAKLIPRTNPFLRDFFDLITGPKLDDEPFAGFVQDVVTLLDCANMGAILEDFGKGMGAGRRRDPVIHFYETFLAAYDPKLRELRGVYYTPSRSCPTSWRALTGCCARDLGSRTAWPTNRKSSSGGRKPGRPSRRNPTGS